MLSYLRVPVIALTAFSLSGCATLFSGTKDTLTIDSNPSGASVLIDGIEMGRTPATFPLKRPGLGSKTVMLRLEGYEPRTFELQTDFNLVSILNLTNVVAWGVDILTGAVKTYSPKNYTITMERSRRAMADELGVDEVVLLGELTTNLTGDIVIPEELKGKEIAVVDPLLQQVVILR